MRILCLTHAPFEGPGFIEDWARLRGHVLEQISLADSAPPGADAIDMLVVLGGPMSADDDRRLPWLAAEKRFIGRVVAVGRPVLGICLGAQLLALVLGGTFRRNPEAEVGWFPVRLTAEGRSARVFERWPSEFVAGLWHGDTFELPEGLATAASSEACANQAFVAEDGRAVGLQFHPEWTDRVLRMLVDACGADLTPGTYVQPVEELLGRPEHLEAGRVMLFDLLDAMAEASA
jgi:GMP synthase-like glutamine amidotransferase